MAAGDDDDGAQRPPSERIRDVIPHFRAVKRFAAEKPTTHITSLDFDDTGELAIVSRTDDTLQIYNIKEGKHAKELKSHKYGVDLARFSHHAQSIIHASTKKDDTIRYLSTHDNSYIRYFKGHTSRVTCLTMSPSSDSFISCAEDNEVRIWDINSQNAQGVLRLRDAYLAAYDPSATVLAIAAGTSHSVLLYDLRNYDKQPFATFDLQSIQANFDREAPEGRNWTKLEFSNDGKNLLVGTAGAGHYVLDSFEGNLRYFCRRPSPSTRSPPGQFTVSEQKPAGQGDVCFTPDGQFLIGGSGGEDGLVVWDVRGEGSGKETRPWAQLPNPDGKRDRGEVVMYNPRFNMLASADRSLLMWMPDRELYSPQVV